MKFRRTKTFYVHVAYKTGDGRNQQLVGDTILKLKEGTRLAQVREMIMEFIKADKSLPRGVEWNSPTIISLTEISQALYHSLMTKEAGV